MFYALKGRYGKIIVWRSELLALYDNVVNARTGSRNLVTITAKRHGNNYCYGLV